MIYFTQKANKITFLFMKHIFDESYLESNIEKFLKIGKSYYDEPEGRDFLKSLLIYIYSFLESGQEKVKESLSKISETGEEIAMTIATQIKQEGIREGKIEDALKMIGKGFLSTDISDITGLTIEQIDALRHQ